MNNLSKSLLFIVLGIGITMSFIAGWLHEIVLLLVSYSGVLFGLFFTPKE